MIGHNGNIKTLIICALTLSIFSACAEHFSLLTDEILVPLQVNLTYDSSNVSQLDEGEIRCVVKAYPAVQEGKEQTFSEEFTFTGDLLDDFDNQLVVAIPEGDYNIMVWADLIEDGAGAPFYDVADFGEIRLVGEHRGSTDYRDAFCGVATVSVDADESSSLTVEMERPLARFELVSDDLPEFVGSQAGLADGSATLDDYTAVVFYQGYVPTVYSLYADKPVDSQTGVMFTSALTELNDNEVSLGFDYVFIGEKSSYVTVRVGVYDLEGKQVSLTSSIKVPLQRNECTVKSGSFLTSKSSDGINIDKELDGNHNIEF